MRLKKPKKLGVRILSGFLSLMMVCSAFPVTAFAEEMNMLESESAIISVMDGYIFH